MELHIFVVVVQGGCPRITERVAVIAAYDNTVIHTQTVCYHCVPNYDTKKALLESQGGARRRGLKNTQPQYLHRDFDLDFFVEYG